VERTSIFTETENYYTETHFMSELLIDSTGPV